MSTTTRRTATAKIPRQRAGAGVAAPVTRAQAPAPAPVVHTDGLAQVTSLVRDGFAGLRHVHRSPRRIAIWMFWLVGIVGDAVTTLVLLSGDGFIEGNPAAAVGMGFLGLTGYVVLASAICLFMATVSTGRPTGPIAVAAVIFLLLVATGKVAMAVNNTVLLVTTT